MSRRALILANLGSRDVKHDGQFPTSPRQDGAWLNEQYREESEKIELPIIGPSIGYILGEWGEEFSGAIVGLFYTDQDDPRFRDRDTVELAGVVRRKLLEGPGGLGLAGGKSVRLERIPGNPSRYDEMYAFYRRFFAEESHLANPEEWLCFVLTAGGTPAANAGLLLHAVEHFEENCVQIYVADGFVTDMRIGEQILRTHTERDFNVALESLQFKAAAQTLESLPFGGYRVLACRYAEKRLAFDFRRAITRCRGALNAADREEEKLLQGELEAAEMLRAGTGRSLLIAELFYNLEVKYANGEYVDVLGRVFRLYEALLQWVMENTTGLRFDGENSLHRQMAEVESVPGLRAHLEKNSVELARPVNRHSLRAVVGHLETPAADLGEGWRNRARSAVGLADKLEELAALRNKSILAHGFEGVSEEQLVGTYGSDTLIEDLRAPLSEVLGRDLSVNPFFELAEKLKF